MIKTIREIRYHETWSIRQRVLWPDKPMEYVQLPNDIDALHYGLFLGNELVSVLSIFSEHKFVQLRKFATLENYRNNGYGSELLTHVLTEVIGNETEKVWCNARIEKVGYYENRGFIQLGNTFYKDSVEFVRMEREVRV